MSHDLKELAQLVYQLKGEMNDRIGQLEAQIEVMRNATRRENQIFLCNCRECTILRKCIQMAVEHIGIENIIDSIKPKERPVCGFRWWADGLACQCAMDAFHGGNIHLDQTGRSCPITISLSGVDGDGKPTMPEVRDTDKERA